MRVKFCQLGSLGSLHLRWPNWHRQTSSSANAARLPAPNEPPLAPLVQRNHVSLVIESSAGMKFNQLIGLASLAKLVEVGLDPTKPLDDHPDHSRH